METSICKFVSEHASKLINLVENYLQGGASHKQVYDYTCEVIDDWHKLESTVIAEQYVKQEKQFWALLWAMQTLASKSHWADGLPQRELPLLLDALKTNGKLVEGYDWRRPNPTKEKKSAL